MTTATEMVSWALQLIRVVDPGEDLTDYQYNGGRRALNAMLRRWEANGLALGWQDIDNPADPLPLPPEAEQAVAYNLALMLRPLYGATPETDVMRTAATSLNDLLRDQAVAAPLMPILSAPWPSAYWYGRGGSYNGFIG